MRMREGVEESVVAVLRRDRLLVWAAVAGLSAAAWLYLWRLSLAMPASGAGPDAMAGMPGMGPALAPWTGADVGFTVVMWAVMMLGMMLPAAAPVILLVTALNRKRRAQGGPAGPTAAFILGYLVVWGGFSVGAAFAQWGLHGALLLSPAMATTSSLLGGALLLVAGAYQLTPLKKACLVHCRNPLGFLMTEWRDGTAGALRMGIRHGVYCLGCCVVLMGLLFVTGVMNLVWVAVITLFVLLERVAPGGVLLGRLASGALIVAGLLLLLGRVGVPGV